VILGGVAALGALVDWGLAVASVLTVGKAMIG
jgi:hypothetical protein